MADQDQTIQAVADIIDNTLFSEEGYVLRGQDELCRKAAAAIINYLAGVYDAAKMTDEGS